MDTQQKSELVTEISNLIVTKLEGRLVLIEDEIKKVVRRQDQQQKSLDIMDKDRVILEEGLSVMRSLESLFKQNRDHQNSVNRNMSTEIGEVKVAVEETPSNIRETINESMDKLIEVVERKKITFKNYSFFGSIKNRLSKKH